MDPAHGETRRPTTGCSRLPGTTLGGPGLPARSLPHTLLNQAAVAQLAERMICNLEVGGSNPPGGFPLTPGTSHVLPALPEAARLAPLRASTQVDKGGRL